MHLTGSMFENYKRNVYEMLNKKIIHLPRSNWRVEKSFTLSENDKYVAIQMKKEDVLINGKVIGVL